MLFLYKTNDLDIVVNTICLRIKENPLDNPLTQEIILVNSEEIKQWLNYSLSLKLGITANIKILHIHSYIKKLYKYVIPKKKWLIEIKNDTILWYLLLFSREKNISVFLKKFKNSFEKYLFLSHIADLFKKYIKNRPDWINKWDKKKYFFKVNNQKLQEKIWIFLIQYIKDTNNKLCFYPKLLAHYIKYVNREKINVSDFPNRIFLIGTVQSSIYEILSIISNSKFIDIYLYFFTVSKHKINTNFQQKETKFVSNKIFDFTKRYDIFIKKIKNKNKRSNFNNYLLNLWGNLELDSIFFLKEIDHQYVNLYKNYNVDEKNKTLLNLIKSNIVLDREENLIKGFQKKLYNKKNVKENIYIDNSIEIHICYSIQTEVQVLHNNLLQIFNNNPDIFPHDVIVKSTNINIYLPFIKTIFNSVKKTHYIPFIIINKKINTDNVIFNSFFKLLNLSKCNFFHEEIFCLLRLPCIYKKFLLNKQEVIWLYDWTKQSNIKWGIDQEHLKKLNLPIDMYNTWEKGINRMILSCSINTKEKVIWNNTFPSHDFNLDASNVLNKFLIFISFLKKWKSKLSTSKKIKNWTLIGKNIIHDFYVKNKKTSKYFKLILNAWKKTITTASIIKHYRINILLLIEEILKNINNFKRKNKIFIGSVIISDFYSFEYIPYKVTYLLGFNEESYPEIKHYDFFDLTSDQKTTTYHNTYELKKYCFLVTLTNTKNFFFISYSESQHLYKDKTSQSPFIKELEAYIQKIININLNYCNNKEIKKKNFSIKYDHSTIIHNQKELKKNSILTEFSQKYLKMPKIYHESNLNIKKKFYSISIFNKNTILIKKFILFWKNPIFYFFKYYLNIFISKKHVNVSEFEPFSIDYLHRYKLNDEIFNYKLKNKKINTIFNRFLFSGKLPYKYFGESCFLKQEEEIDNIIKKISFLTKKSFKKNVFNLKINNISLKGKIQILTEKKTHKFGVFCFKPSVLKLKDGISFWIQHLVYCALGGKKPSMLIGSKNSEWHLTPLNKKKATYYLIKYINGFIVGSKNPILLTSSGMYWLNTIFDKKLNQISSNECIVKASKEKFMQIWNGNQFQQGEKDDIFLQKLIPNLNEQIIKKILKNAKKWFLPILKHSFRKVNIS
ncbi:exodeoxyribonuclease V subunit gamma [Buchnera aphidicola]|uniref:RecC C-terminal domain-containing protein n=1 Tax=Buchnera aphidicola (Anoecia oenotherae) TaxID=1241833 RepID=A0A4D6XYC8_9GAMM|nr:exodeoxyribonuclease V subunit gamma [Buchnera aphidicola]QCI19468.1 hypothetical protein D9V65_01805 [Buchnera aphidicola (Anoecia oenotherae)]